MGACGSSPEAKAALAKSRELDDENTKYRRQFESFVKLLLLGAGESGKSTIFKQMKVIYGKGYGPAERLGMVPTILTNLISGCKIVLAGMEQFKDEDDQPDPLKVVSSTDEEKNACGMASPEAAAAFIASYADNTGADLAVLPDDVHLAIKTLWKNESFHTGWERRSEYQLFDAWHKFAREAAKSYENESHNWGKANWTPSVDDLMNARVRTSGIVEDQFEIDGVPLKMFDVGGQRNERKKWIHCFEGVQAIIFVGAISEYDQVLFEDVNQNRLLEAITLFGEITNNAWFISTAMILFLNKIDLFEEKYLVKKIPLNKTGLKLFDTAPSHEGLSDEQEYKKAKCWFLAQFEQKNINKEKQIYSHFTCATDTENVRIVLKSCSDIILKKNMGGSGFS